MAELEFKYLNEIDISDSLTDSAHVIIEDGGNIRRAPMGQLITGGGVSSWNDLTDKPFYEEGSFEEILPETTLTMNNVSGMGMGSITVDHTKIILGKTYKMVWDGVAYEAPAFEVSGQSGESGEVMTLVAIGNPVIGNLGEDNGIPFFAGNATNGEGVPTDNLMVITTDTAATHTLSISVGSTTIHTIDEKFIPDTIARVFDIPEVNYPVTSVNGQTGDVVIEVGSGSSIQADMAQNDPTQPDYVKNRTHWVEGSGATIEWDGNTEGRDSFVGFGSMTYYKVSDVTPALEDLIGSTLSAADDSMTYTESDLAQTEGAVVQCDGVFVVVQQAESFTMTGEETLTAPSNGMYFPSMGGVAITFTYGSTIIHTIDEKFIPDTIARVKDIPEQKAITVNGIEPDENGNIEIEVGSGPGLPEVSVENNGAFLRVVDGAWAIVNITDVSIEGA